MAIVFALSVFPFEKTASHAILFVHETLSRSIVDNSFGYDFVSLNLFTCAFPHIFEFILCGRFLEHFWEFFKHFFYLCDFDLSDQWIKLPKRTGIVGRFIFWYRCHLCHYRTVFGACYSYFWVSVFGFRSIGPFFDRTELLFCPVLTDCCRVSLMTCYRRDFISDLRLRFKILIGSFILYYLQKGR